MFYLLKTQECRDVAQKCNLDEEFRSVRDVQICCQLDRKEQKDVCIYVNTEPPPPPPKQLRDCWTYVHMEDAEKIDLQRKIVELTTPKCTRDVSVSFDQRTRFVDNMVKNQSSSIEQIRTFSRQCNTESRVTRDSSCGPAFDWNRYSDKGCQVTDYCQQEATTSLMTQKGTCLISIILFDQPIYLSILYHSCFFFLF